jgi:hypothetical protein
MTNTTATAPIIETAAPNGHITYTIKVGDQPVAVRWQHVVTGLWYVEDLTADMSDDYRAYKLVAGVEDEWVARAVFTKLYKRHTG